MVRLWRGREVHWQLLSLSLIAAMHGIGYIVPLVPVSGGLASLGLWIKPLAALWIAAGLFGALCATTLPPGHWWARPFIGGMCWAWATVTAVGWVGLDATAGWFWAVVYVLLGMAVVTPPRQGDVTIGGGQ